jgi:hypothetical protein
VVVTAGVLAAAAAGAAPNDAVATPFPFALLRAFVFFSPRIAELSASLLPDAFAPTTAITYVSIQHATGGTSGSSRQVLTRNCLLAGVGEGGRSPSTSESRRPPIASCFVTSSWVDLRLLRATRAFQFFTIPVWFDLR